MNVLYYAHQHGSGHCKNAEYFGKVLPDNLYVATSSKYKFSYVKHVIRIKPEHERKSDLLGGREMLPNYLHYSPVGNSFITKRSFDLLKLCIKQKIGLAIVDLSVEVASLFRAASIPYAYVRLPGNRNDIPHLEVFRSALFLLAYFPKELEDEQTPEWIKAKTIYLGFMITDIPPITNSFKIPPIIQENLHQLVTVVKGFGGSDALDKTFLQFKKKYPENFYLSLGPVKDEVINEYDYVIDFTPNVHDYFRLSQRIIAPASLNLTAEVLQHKKPFTVVGCHRHFDEQKRMAYNLIQKGYADSLESGLKKEFKVFKTKHESKPFMERLKYSKNIRDFYYNFITPLLNEK